MADGVPSETDWRSEPWDLDMPYAYKHFAGKSFEEAVELFKENALRYQEDVMFMPRACFPYYARAYMAYLMSENSVEDADGASCFFGLADVRADDIKTDRNLVTEFIVCLDHLAKRQSLYDADIDIYGNFPDRSERAKSKLLVASTGN